MRCELPARSVGHSSRVSSKTGKRLGELLVDAGVVSPDQLKLALSEQRRNGARLGAILVALGIASDEAISRAVASQSGVEHVDLEALLIERQRDRPEKIARRYTLVPVRVEKDTLFVVMANPSTSWESMKSSGRPISSSNLRP